jgi:hypothetical protein
MDNEREKRRWAIIIPVIQWVGEKRSGKTSNLVPAIYYPHLALQQATEWVIDAGMTEAKVKEGMRARSLRGWAE